MQLESIPRIRFGFYPTPLEEMPRLREVLGDNCPRLLIKRDDYTGLGFGGNKVRKIEYALGREIENGVKTVITVGGEKSNHARITAAACAKLGLKCILILNRSGESPGDDPVPASRFAYEMFGAEVFWVKRREDRDSTAFAITQELITKGEKAACLPLGLSIPIGALGYVAAYREMIGQCDKLGVRPDHIFHSSSSGGTQAGLVYGAKESGDDPSKIIGVSPDDPADEITRHVVSIAQGIGMILGSDPASVNTDDVTVLDSYIGRGYGLPTQESDEAEKLFARHEGVLLDPLYTEKAAAAMIDWIRSGKFTRDQTVLFWHTGGQFAHFHALPKQSKPAAGERK